MRVKDVVQQQAEEPLLRWGLSVALTTGVWSLFGWLLVTLVTLVLWAFGVTTAYAALVVDVAEVDVVLLLQVVLAAVVLAAVLVLWAQLQRHRFVGKERRRRPEDVTVGEVAVALGATAQVAAALRAAQVVVVQLDDDGRPVAVLPGAAVPPGAAVVPTVPHQRGPQVYRPEPGGRVQVAPGPPQS